MVDEAEVRGRLSEMLANQLSLEEFEDWLVSRSWNMHKDSTQGVQDLVWSIQLPLMAFGDARLTTEQLRRELVSILNHPKAEFSIEPQGVHVRGFRPKALGATSISLLGVQPTLPDFSLSTSSSGMLVTA